MKATSRSRFGVFLTLTACALSAEAVSAPTQKVPLPRPRPVVHAGKQATAPATIAPSTTPLPQKRAAPKAGLSSFAQANVGLHGAMFETRAFFKPLARPTSGPFAIAPTSATSDADIAAVKRVIESARKGKEADANAAEASISDPVARKLAEWVILRSDNTNPSFQRYAAFVERNPSWPHAPLFRRRAENALWNDGVDDRTVRAFFGRQQPATAKGRYMLARALLAQGDRDGAAALVRHAWRHEDASADVEKRVLEMFGSMLTCRRPQGAHGAALLCRRCRGRHARGRAARRRRTCHWARPRGGVAEGWERRRRCSMRCLRRHRTTPAIFSRASNGCAKTTKRKKPAS